MGGPDQVQSSRRWLGPVCAMGCLGSDSGWEIGLSVFQNKRAKQDQAVHSKNHPLQPRGRTVLPPGADRAACMHAHRTEFFHFGQSEQLALLPSFEG